MINTKSILGVPFKKAHMLLPGLIAASLLAWLSIKLSNYIGINLLGYEKSPISAVMVAILFGLVISNIVSIPSFLKIGLTFAVKKVLRLGIILLGIRLSIFEVLKLGVIGVPIVLVCILSALFLTTVLSKKLKIPERLGILIAVGTSICGVSAIVATGPAIEAKDEEVTYAVAVITLFGIIATLVYPYLANVLFAGDPFKIGIFLGTSIHDTSQVTGAALVYSYVYAKPRALDVAVVTKLVRNIFMVLVIPFMAFWYSRKKASKNESVRKGISNLLPLFIVGFLICAVLRSIGDAGIINGEMAFGLWNNITWKNIYSFIKHWAVNFLVVALAGVGLSTRMRMLKGMGIKPFIIGICAASVLGVVSFIMISLLGSFVAL